MEHAHQGTFLRVTLGSGSDTGIHSDASKHPIIHQAASPQQGIICPKCPQYSGWETLLYYRLSFPFVCLLCVCLGLPLAVKNERSGIFLSIIAAVAAIVVFQTLTEIFLIMGQQGMVPPLVGGVGPMFAFLLYSYFGVIRKSS